MEPVFLTLGEVLEIHSDQINRYGGDPGIRDLGLLQSALAIPASGFGGHPGMYASTLITSSKGTILLVNPGICSFGSCGESLVIDSAPSNFLLMLSSISHSLANPWTLP